jgi:hypothetical protein
MFTNVFKQMPSTRRNFLIGAGVAGAALPILLSEAADAEALAGSGGPALDTPTGMLETYIKLSGDMSGKNYGGWYSGHAFAVQPDKMIRPLVGFTGFGLGSDHRQPDGSFHHLWKEVGFYTDLKTGEVLESWVNPLNGMKCDVMPIHNRSVNLTFAAKLPDMSKLEKIGGGIMNPNFAHEGDPDRPYGLPYAIIGDQLSVFADSVGLVPNPLDPKVWKRESAGPMIDVGEFYMITGSRRLVLDPKVTNVPATGSWTRIGPFLPWMLMGQAPGHLFYRSATKKITGPEALPPKLVAYARAHYPEFLNFPTDWSVPIESSWEVFKRSRTPHV